MVAFHNPPCFIPDAWGIDSSPWGIMAGCLFSPPTFAPFGPLYSGVCCHVGASSQLWSVSLLRDASPSRGFAPTPYGALAPPSPEVRGFILSPHPVFYCSHPWPVRPTRHCGWRRRECGGVGVGGGFPFTFWLAHFNVLAYPSPFFTQRPPTPGSLQLCWVLHPSAASHRTPCYCTIYRSGRRLSELVWCAPGGDRSGVWLGSDQGFSFICGRFPVVSATWVFSTP